MTLTFNIKKKFARNFGSKFIINFGLKTCGAVPGYPARWQRQKKAVSAPPAKLLHASFQYSG